MSATLDNEQQLKRCARLWRALLQRSLADLSALLSGAPLPPDESGRPMTEAERHQLLGETLDWFLNPEPSPVSLEVVCDNLGLNAGDIRRRVRQLAHGDIQVATRRPKLTDAQRLYVIDALARGQTTRQLAEDFHINPATVRKIRIRHRTRARVEPAKLMVMQLALLGEPREFAMRRRRPARRNEVARVVTELPLAALWERKSA